MENSMEEPQKIKNRIALWSSNLEQGNPLQYSCLENLHGQRSLVATVHGITKTQRWDSVVPLAVNSMWMKSGRKGKVKVVYSEQWWLVSHVPGKWHCHICASQTSQREIGLNGICKPVLTVLIWKHYSKKLTSIDVTRFPRDPWHKNGQEPLFDLVALCWNGN